MAAGGATIALQSHKLASFAALAREGGCHNTVGCHQLNLSHNLFGPGPDD